MTRMSEKNSENQTGGPACEGESFIVEVIGEQHQRHQLKPWRGQNPAPAGAMCGVESAASE
jgi:hypothetical protein